MIVTISGLIGSGKTTLARNISKRLNFRYISVGEIMRKMAEERGISLLEFSRYAELNPEIDREIDKRQKSLVDGNCIVDGRLSAFFLNPDLRIWIMAPLDTRIERIAKRDNLTREEAEDVIIKREESERKRYREIYDINLDDIGIYDIIINTERFSIEDATRIVSEIISLKNGKRTSIG